jgi:hypothetical protein
MSHKQKTVFVIIGIIILLSVFIFDNVNRFWEGTRVDFPSYYYGAKLTFEENLTPYTRDNWDYAIELFNQEQDLYPYIYIPPSVFLFYPLLTVNYQTSQSALFILNHLLIALIFWLFIYRILGLPAHSTLPVIAAAYIALFSPFKMEIRAGQMDIIILVLLVTTWWGLKEKRHPAFIILPMVIVILLKVTPIIFLFILFIRKEYKSLLWIVIILIVLSMIAHFTLPENMWRDWFDWVGGRGYGQVISTRLTPSGFGVQNFNGFFSRIFLGRGSTMESLVNQYFDFPIWQRETGNRWMVYISVILASGLSLGLITFRKPKGKDFPSLDFIFSILLVLMFLVAPLSHDHHLIYLLPAIFVLFIFLLNESQYNWQFWLGAIVAAALAYPFDNSNPMWRQGLLMLMISFKFYAVLILWGIFLWIFFQNTEPKKVIIRH